MARLASVYPLVTARAVARPFTYEVPDEVERGAIVDVRFGNARRRAIVTEVGVDLPEGITAAPVERVAQTRPPALVDLALWLPPHSRSRSPRGRRGRFSISRCASRPTTARRPRARCSSSRRTTRNDGANGG